eukprot:6738020-Prymnesium_polylepis.1
MSCVRLPSPVPSSRLPSGSVCSRLSRLIPSGPVRFRLPSSVSRLLRCLPSPTPLVPGPSRWGIRQVPVEYNPIQVPVEYNPTQVPVEYVRCRLYREKWV